MLLLDSSAEDDGESGFDSCAVLGSALVASVLCSGSWGYFVDASFQAFLSMLENLSKIASSFRAESSIFVKLTLLCDDAIVFSHVIPLFTCQHFVVKISISDFSIKGLSFCLTLTSSSSTYCYKCFYQWFLCLLTWFMRNPWLN